VDIPGLEEDEFTELYNATVPRVDLVGKGANGLPFLLAKEAGPGGLLGADTVRDLIAKGDPDSRGRVEMPNGLTISGSPGAIAAFIHGAPFRSRDSGAGAATAGQPEEKVSKDMGPELDGDPGAMDALDVTVPLAEPEAMAPGDPAPPGTPAWEGIDAASARKWLSVAARLKNALGVLAEREMLEAASADPDDIENAWNLEDAMCAVDYAIEQLAVFAACEEAEAELGAELEAIGKALAGFDTDSLAVIEGAAEIRKSGRVLSKANENAIRGAVESLQQVLASLPEAPVAKSQEVTMTQAQAADVAKETSSASAQGQAPAAATVNEASAIIKSALAQPVLIFDRAGRMCTCPLSAIREPVLKADGDDPDKPKMQAVFDQQGDLIGVVDPAAITPVAGAATPAAAEPEPAEGDMQPQPPADAGTPAADVAKTAGDTTNAVTSQDVLKSVTDALAALGAQQATLLEAVAKSTGNGELAARYEEIKARLEVVEKQPAQPKVFTGGQAPPPGSVPERLMRGQDKATAAAPVDMAKAAQRREEFRNASPAEQNRLAKEMQEEAISELAALHNRG
jgi:hypothetical protein